MKLYTIMLLILSVTVQHASGGRLQLNNQHSIITTDRHAATKTAVLVQGFSERELWPRDRQAVSKLSQ